MREDRQDEFGNRILRIEQDLPRIWNCLIELEASLKKLQPLIGLLTPKEVEKPVEVPVRMDWDAVNEKWTGVHNANEN